MSIRYPTFIQLVDDDDQLYVMPKPPFFSTFGVFFSKPEQSPTTVVDGGCEDSDPNCPYCAGRCSRDSAVVLLRVDLADASGTAFCGLCSEDALSTGLFTIVGE